MKFARKKEGKVIKAYQLGCNHPMEIQLMKEGVLKQLENGSYELFSREAKNGKGEIARAGDYFKVDEEANQHYPYPNAKDWFEKRHIHIKGDDFEQIPEDLMIYQVEDGESEEIQYLLDHQLLTIHEEDDEHYFNAFLWGANLSAPKDATVVFYHVKRNDKNEIVDISFNFVVKQEFEKNYKIIK